ncbi:MAG: rhamnose transport system permease protein [Chloroflexota bacterium]|nr:rhamnose transport system permease protein [Chloroflexota bacterium]
MKADTSHELKSESLIAEKPEHYSLTTLFKHWEWMLVALIVAVVMVNTRLSPYFLNANNISRTSSDFMETGLMMLPMVFIIITGNIDLSVASNMGMSASFMGLLHNMGVNIWVAALAGLALGTLGGVLNGYLVGRVKLPALVVTLGTYAFFRGLAYGFLGDQAARNYPPEFTYLGQGKVFGTLIPFSVALFAVLALIFGLVLHKTKFGRYLYAIGNNENAAIYSGVPVAKIKFNIFVLSGFISALAGLILAARFGSTRPDNGTGLELSVITAAVLGGVDINGGRGTMYGAVLSLSLIGLLKFGMGLINIQGQVQSMVIGLLLITSILLPHVIGRASNLRMDRIRWKSVLAVVAAIVVFIAFFVFFFWSRNVAILL